MDGYQLIAAADGPIDLAVARALEAAAGAVSGIEPFVRASHHGLALTCPVPTADRAGAVALRHGATAAIGDRLLDLAVRVLPLVPPRLAVFDMDSTLLSIEVIDELARAHGVGAEVAAITERAMRGELDFEASLRTRVRQLRGLPASALTALATALPLSPGARALVTALRARGVRCAIASGGFTFAADALTAELGFDHAFANTLELADGVVTGEVVGPVVTAERKAAVVTDLAARYGIAPAATIAVGDGANDRHMLAAAGFGVAFHPKPALAAVADAVIAHGPLDRLLAFLP